MLVKEISKNKDLIFEERVDKGKYNCIAQPQFNMDVFNHNYQKYENNKLSEKFFSYS